MQSCRLANEKLFLFAVLVDVAVVVAKAPYWPIFFPFPSNSPGSLCNTAQHSVQCWYNVATMLKRWVALKIVVANGLV